MRAWKVVAGTLAFTGVDVTVTTLLYKYSRSDGSILQDLKHFNIFDSMLDIWGACLYRSCVLLGAAFGVAKNTNYGPKRLKGSRIFIMFVCLVVGIYALVKLLLYSEVRKTIKDPWFWGLFAWTYLSLAATFSLWQLLSSVRPSRETLGVNSESRTEAEEGGDPRLPDAQGKKEEASAATICKLLSYTKPDAHFLVVAFVFLLVAALGDIISRLTSDTTIVSDLVSQNINIFLRNMVKATGVIVFMFSLSWQLSLVTFMGFPIIMLVSDLYGKYYKKLSKEVQNALAKANNTAEETISAMKTVRSFANEEVEANVYRDKLQQVYRLNKKEAMAYTYYVWSSGLTLLIVQVSILYYGGHLVISDQMTSGNLISFIIYEFVLGDCMESIGSVYSGLMQGVGAAEKVFEFIDRKPTMVNDGTLAPSQLEGKVEFKNVTFAYHTRPTTQVLQNVSFTLPPGQVTALVGPSGSGKSSCVNIMENFYPLQDGQVLLDGQPINMYEHKYLHTVTSLVSQEPVLFARSIAENISYGLASVPYESVIQAAQKANAHTFITELQDGYHTEAGEKGTQLSGGQKQRVAIARALIRNPPILILDEATSALDAESEHAIQRTIYGDVQNHTVLVIAHRLSTVEKAHNIIVLDKGCVVQQGTHKQLMEEGGLYYKLVQRQILGHETGTGDGSQLDGSLAGIQRESPKMGLAEEFQA
ncbi:ABC-type oligopeptide transporter ABCB9 isoform X2 [Rhineura floridana]|uniref:ABC-type oligopeptide transporter ABCB9 isoform X2 n=1 Tax=Rhineura floridana TaxID=261503 RepID=UPI002AC84136|nr:ABC-type oligopeptide transporter ABCB9 isoform X2 [Rhineura floridana]